MNSLSRCGIRPGRGGHSASPHGFTLLELMLVLFVIALATLVVSPDLKPLLEGTRVRAAVRKTASFLDSIRTQAVLTNETLVVALSEAGSALVVRPEGDEERLVDEISLETVLSGPVEELLVSPERIRYYPKGSSSGGEVLFQRDGDSIATIEVGSFTGLTRIVEGKDR